MYRDDSSPSRLQRLANASWPLFRAFGVDVRVHWSVLFVPPVLFASAFLSSLGRRGNVISDAALETIRKRTRA